MDIANITVALGGDSKNTVPKHGVTAAEIAVLQAIHGADAISDVQPAGTIVRANRVERDRLFAEYGRAKDNNDQAIVGLMFPGVAARVHEKLDELDLHPDAYKALARASAPAAVAQVDEAPGAEDEDVAEFTLDDKTVKQLKEILAEQGKEAPAGAKKQELIDLIRAGVQAPGADVVGEGDELDELPADDEGANTGVLS